MSQQKDYPCIIPESAILGFYLGSFLWIFINILIFGGIGLVFGVAGMTIFFLGLLWYDAYVLIKTVLKRKVREPSSILLFIEVTLVAISALSFLPIYLYGFRREIIQKKR